ncbi:alpha/beta fold hydrolase [Nocardia sp. KC 131]|uniref:alpha/beta fold hydrolase n=1 Tax=Nocardia arseniciresistens TaxID=3392119 RepID=UPI00398F1DC8
MSSGLIFSTGAHDDRLHDIDDDFHQLLTDFAQLTAMGKLTRTRVFHAPGIVVRGHIDFFDSPGVPVHPFFADGKRYPILARYSNGVSNDDLAPGIRGLSLRWFDPDGSGGSPFNLTFNTGYRVFAPNAWTFMKFFMLRDDSAREELVRATPGAVEPALDAIRDPHPYDRYHLNSQVPQQFIDGTGRPWLVRYRLVPEQNLPDVGHHTPRGWVVPPIERLMRESGDRRSSTLLRDEIRKAATENTLRGLFQIQLHPLGDDTAANQAALSPSSEWPVASHPFRTIGAIRLNLVCDGDPAAELPFDPADAPEGLGIALARSPFEAASMNHARALVYRAGYAARTFRPDPTSSSAPPTTEPLPANGRRTVCVIGAGPGGLVAANELERLGHTVVVLEREAVAGGKSVSVQVDGRAYDLGAHLCNDRYEHFIDLADEFGLATEDIIPPHIFDAQTFTTAMPKTAFATRQIVGRYMRLRAESFPDIGRPGLAHSARALSQPARDWLRDNDLETMAASLGAVYTSAGYGYLADDLPALYFLKVSETVSQLSTEPTRTRHANAFTISGGLGALWERVAAKLADVRTGVEITAIDRSGDRVAVHLADGHTVHADDLVLSVPLDRLDGVLDMSLAERALALKIRRLDFYTVLCRITGLPRNGHYTVRSGDALPGPGHCVSFHHRYAETDVYVCYSYGADGLTTDDIVANLRDDVVAFGGELTEVLLVRHWPYFPHFASRDLAEGVYDKLEERQGRRRTYHVGGLLGFEMIETTIAHARDVVAGHFAEGEIDDAPGTNDHRSPVPGRTVAEINAWLISRLAREFDLAENEIGPQAVLDDFPLDSLAVAAMHLDLSAWLGLRIHPTILLENPTIESVANRLAQVGTDTPSTASATALLPPLAVPLTPPRPFFCIPGVNGIAYQFRTLASALGPWCPFTALQAPGHDGSEPTLNTVEALAERYLLDIRATQPHGPYLVGGYSLGGMIAYEVAGRLRAAGEEVGEVVLIDTYVPLAGQPTPPWDERAALDELAAMLRAAAGASGHELVLDPDLSLEQRRDAVCRQLTSGSTVSARRQLQFIQRVYQANLEANVRYRPPESDLPVTLLRARGEFPIVFGPARGPRVPLGDRTQGWDTVATGRFRIVDVPGNHFTILSESRVGDLADALRHVLPGGRASTETMP